MRRVVVTGLGAVSCIGNSKQAITESLKAGRSGIVFNESFAEVGYAQPGFRQRQHRYQGAH